MPSRLLARAVLLVMAVALASSGTASLVAGATIPRTAQSDGDVMRSIIDEARSRPSIAGPLAGNLDHAIGSTPSVFAGVDAPNLYARARFTNPYPAAEHPWDIGFGFRTSQADQEFRLIVDSGDGWYLMDGPNTPLVSGALAGIQPNANETNLLELVAIDDRGYFALNGQFVTSVELPAVAGGGDVWAGSGFFAEDVIAGETTPFADFEVWSLGLSATAPADTPVSAATPETSAAPALEPGADGLAQAIANANTQPSIVGPLAGDMVQSAGSATTISSSIDIQDFSSRVRFINPADATSWDYGLAFRDQPTGEHYRLVIDASGTWNFSVGLELDIASGTLANLDTSPGGANEIDLAVAGDTGAFAVNGEFVANLDTSRLLNSGSVWVGTAFAAANTTDGAVVRYEAFEVWPLVGETTPTAPLATGTAAEPTVQAATPEPPIDDPVAIFEAARDRARQQPSIAPAQSGSLLEELDRLVFEEAGVVVTDFYASVEFLSPRDPEQFPWDVGIVFRATPDTQYRLVVRSNGQWVFALGTDELIDTGNLPGLRTGINESNTLELVVNGDRAFVAVNGEVTAELDVSAHTEAGEVALASAFFGDDALEGGTTRYEGFEVWPLEAAGSPVATTLVDATATVAPDQPVIPAVTASADVDGEQLLAEAREQAARQPREAPRSGELVETAGQITFEPVNISARDFYAIVRFQNPAGTGGEPWDYGLAFRINGDDDYRLILRSSGEWGLLQRSVAEPIAIADVAALQLEPEAINTLELVARGDVGVFAVNGQVVATLDLSSLTTPGDVNVGTTFIAGDGVSGRSIRYSDLAVVPLDDASAVATEPAATSSPASPTPSATPDAPTPTPAVTMTPAAVMDLSAAEAQRIFDEARELALQQPTPDGISGQLDDADDADDASADQNLNLTTADFYARARLQNPSGSEPWDYGLVFRLAPTGDYHLVIESTGDWHLTLHATSLDTIDSGTAPSFRTEAGAINTVELVARGDTGVLAINGTVVDAFDISVLITPGDIEIASGFLTDDGSPGPAIQYRDFFAVPLDDATAANGPPSPVAATPTVTAAPEAQAVLEAILTEARQQTPATSRPTGTLVESLDRINSDIAALDARDIVIQAAIENPRDLSLEPFDVGFFFRESAENYLQLTIRSTGDWVLSNLDSVIDSGTVPNLQTAAGATNTIQVVAVAEAGLLVLNDEVVATLDLSSVVAPGNASLATGMYTDDTVDGAITTYRDLTVWILDQAPGAVMPVATVGPETQADFDEVRDEARQSPPLAAIANGELVEGTDDQWFMGAGVDLQDFYVTVDFENPRGPGERPWEVSVSFRDTVGAVSAEEAATASPDDGFYQIYLRADDEWTIVLSRGRSSETIAAGSVPNLRTGAGDLNTMEFLVTGDTGLFAVNGTVVTTLDLSDFVAPGEVYVNVHGLDPAGTETAITRFQNLQVWSLDDTVGLAASPVAATPAAATQIAPTPTVTSAPSPTPTATATPEPLPTVAAALATVVIELLPIDTPAPTEDAVEQIAVRLEERDGSGISGLAILTGDGETTSINLTLFGGSGDEPAVIHEGMCDNRSPEPAFLLPPPGPGGVIRTTLPVPLAELRSMPHSIDTHASDAEFSALVACGNIT